MARKKRTSHLMLGASASLLLAFQAGEAKGLSCPQPLVFGDIIPCAMGDIVTITPSGTRSVNGCLSAASNHFSQARCIISQNSAFSELKIMVTAASHTLDSGAHTMKIDHFNLMTDAGGPSITQSGASIDLPIGASLNVKTMQPKGHYTGAFTIHIILP